MEKNAYLEQKRAERESALRGKFVIVCDSRYTPGTMMYLQDSKLSNQQGHSDMHLTKFLANAKGYDSLLVANNIAKKYQYNNGRVIHVD